MPDEVLQQWEQLLDARDKSLLERIDAVDKANADTVQVMHRVRQYPPQARR
jgi:hypothetical protein